MTTTPHPLPHPPAPLQRVPDWRLQLDALITTRLHRPFGWGTNDCALFAADCVLALTGQDLASGLRGLSARQALRHLRSVGGVAALVPDCLTPLPSVAQAAEGDIALIQQPSRGLRRWALGVVACGGIIGPARAGLAIAPPGAAVLAWGVGRG